LLYAHLFPKRGLNFPVFRAKEFGYIAREGKRQAGTNDRMETGHFQVTFLLRLGQEDRPVEE
jgi:hypothetical protein